VQAGLAVAHEGPRRPGASQTNTARGETTVQSTIDKYGSRIHDGTIDPTRDVNKMGSGLIFDPDEELVPLQVLGFGIYKLDGDSAGASTGDREYVFVPMEGSFTLRVDGQSFTVGREGGPFAAPIGASNASALYVPRDSSYELSGTGEIIYYTAPSSRKMKAVQVKQGEKPNLSRGDLFWRRNVSTLIEPGVSTNLIIGETYSPPALWSGTPIHIHDVGNEAAGESEHEEVYYHRSRMVGREVPNYAVQLLFDGKTMNRAYLCPDRTVVAIPGGSHPVVASPVSDCIYSFGLAGVEGPLGMRDLADFVYLKLIGPLVEELRKGNQGKAAFSVPRARMDRFVAEHHLDELQTTVTEVILRECGISFV
jgi:5-deoxy-glucuronate isomerase